MSAQFGDFIQTKESRQDSGKFQKTQFLKLDEGEHSIRILEPHETRHVIHYINYLYLKCLGDECPICENNKRLMYEHPTDFRDVKGWLPRRNRYYINVLDRTLVKTCSKCNAESGVSSELCGNCGSLLGTASPANTVKVLSGSETLFEDLKVISKSITDQSGERVDIRTYDFKLLVRGKGRDKNITPIPQYNPANAGEIALTPEQNLFDLQNAVIELTAVEMIDVHNGVALKDIFAARRKDEEKKYSDDFMGGTDEESERVREVLNEAASGLFKGE